MLLGNVLHHDVARRGNFDGFAACGRNLCEDVMSSGDFGEVQTNAIRDHETFGESIRGDLRGSNDFRRREQNEISYGTERQANERKNQRGP
jgi:hypothetical protein